MVTLSREISSIIKRDGRRVPFDRSKISNAVKKSFTSLDNSTLMDVLSCHDSDNINMVTLVDNICDLISVDVINEIRKREIEIPTVEQVQDIVEETLIHNDFPSVAKAYILYRYERSKTREMTTRLMKTFEDITFVDSKVSNNKRENANINGNTAMGAMLKYGSEGAKYFNNLFVLNPDHAKAHTDGDIHIHDLDFLTLTTTCCQIDLIRLFKDGFGTGHGYIREPNDIRTYAALCCIAIQANQNDHHWTETVAV